MQEKDTHDKESPRSPVPDHVPGPASGERPIRSGDGGRSNGLPDQDRWAGGPQGLNPLSFSTPAAGARFITGAGARFFQLEPFRKDAEGIPFTKPGVASLGADAVKHLWKWQPEHNYGWRTGRVPEAGDGPLADTIVIDLDVRSGKRGPETMLALAWANGLAVYSIQELAAAASAMLQQTPSGGYHLVWSGWGCPEYGGSNKKWLDRFGNACGVDVRARNAYVCGPGSRLREGQTVKRYALLHVPWAEPGGTLGQCPGWVQELLEEYKAPLSKVDRAAASGHGGSLNGSTDNALARLKQALGTIDPDGPHWLTVSMALKLAIDRDGYPEAETKDLWEAWSEGRFWTSPSAKFAPVTNEARWHSAGRLEGADLGHVFRLEAEALGRLTHRQEGEAMERLEMERALDQAMGLLPVPEEDLSPPKAKGSVGAAAVNGVADNGEGLIMTSFGSVTEKPLQWAWEGVFPQSALSIMLGAPAAGKSQLVLALAAAISRGRPYCGRSTIQGKALYIQNENDAERVLKPRLRVLDADEDKILWVPGVRVPRQSTNGATAKFSTILFNMAQHAELLDKALKADPGIRAAFVDPINAYFGSKADSYKTSDLYGLLTPFMQIAQTRNVPIVGILHPAKSAAGQSGSSVARTPGGVGMSGAARAIWEVFDDPDDPEELWRAEGRNSGNKLFVNGKQSLGGAGAKGFRFAIRETEERALGGERITRAEYLGDVSMSAKQVFDYAREKEREQKEAADGRRAESKGSARATAEALIIETLLQAPENKLSWNVLADVLKSDGISQATAYRARDNLLTGEKINKFYDQQGGCDGVTISLAPGFRMGIP